MFSNFSLRAKSTAVGRRFLFHLCCTGVMQSFSQIPSTAAAGSNALIVAFFTTSGPLGTYATQQETCDNKHNTGGHCGTTVKAHAGQEGLGITQDDAQQVGEDSITHDKVHLVYGTAWKKEDTARLVASAIRNGFRFVDTACQPKHYNEPGVGEGWTSAAAELGLKRSDLYLQTKYTSVDGQDPNRIPYDEEAPITDQVRESLQVSLMNLQTTYLDAWVMHSPFPQMKDTLEAYEAMETSVDEGKVRLLGISNNYDFAKLKYIYENVRIKPSIIQNRFYSDSGFDKEIRSFCQEHGMLYQSFWTLTANRHALATPEVRQLALTKELTPQTLMYAYMMQLGESPPTNTPLDGTTNEEHMKEDVALQNRIRSGEKILMPDEMVLMSRILGVTA